METTKIKEIVDTIIQPYQHTSIKKIYGEPINTQGKTIIPVAKIAFGFGGGVGEKIKGSPDKPEISVRNEKANSNEGGAGFGGGVTANPIGYIEVTPEGTRFVRFDVSKYIFGGVALGLFLSRFFTNPKRK